MSASTLSSTTSASWSKVDPSLLSVIDINQDGILQLGEIRIGGDLIVLATPEIAGLPYVITGVVASVLGLLSGAAGDGGFAGLGGQFVRRGLLQYNAAI